MPHVHKKGTKPDKKRRATVRALYAEGFNCAQIGRKLGVSRQAISAMLKRMGVETRPDPGGV